MVSFISVLTFLVVVSISSLIVRIGAVALTLTGMAVTSARFQARSAFLGVGFTTSESEEILSHPHRREIVMRLMLAGNVGAVSVLGTLLVSALRVRDRNDGLVCSLILVAGLLLFTLVRRSRAFDRVLTRWIGRGLRRYTPVADSSGFGSLLHLCGGDYGVSGLRVEQGSDWIGRRLDDPLFEHPGLRVLGLERADGSYLGAPAGDVTLAVADRLLVYGRTGDVRRLGERALSG